MLGRVLGMALRFCLSVCPLQIGVLLKRMDGSSWFSARGLHSTYPTLRFKEIQASRKVRALFSKTFS